MTVEEFYIKYLQEALVLPVSGDVPPELPERFVTLELTGSSADNHLYKPRLAVQSWAESREASANLNEVVKTAMAASVRLAQVSRCRLETDYNFPDLERKHPRYQAIFQIVFLP